MENKVAGLITVGAAGYFRDAPSGAVNTGPFPPRVNQPTKYTIHWVLKNYSTDVTNIHAAAFLQSNTRFVKVLKSSIGAQPKFNPSSGEITWDIASLPATKGVVGEAVEAIFQIENTPAVNQVSQNVPLVGITRVEAEDTFTGQKLTNTDGEITTQLPDDLTLVDIDHDVKP
jgi:hypothetical protein